MRFVVAIILIEICMNVVEHEKSKLQHRKNQILLNTGMKPNKIFNIKAPLEYMYSLNIWRCCVRELKRIAFYEQKEKIKSKYKSHNQNIQFFFIVYHVYTNAFSRFYLYKIIFFSLKLNLNLAILIVYMVS